jgi:hypothetical protein
VLQHFHDSIGFKSFHLPWVLHLLTDNSREKRKEHARALLPFWHAAERDGWHHFVTGNESWLFLNTSPRRMWTLSRDDVVTKSRIDIQSKKFMFIIIWNPSGFYIVDRFPNDTKMNSAYFMINILIRLISLIPLEKRSFIEEGRRIKNGVEFISTIVQFTQVGF